jgi:hypothetical protein
VSAAGSDSRELTHGLFHTLVVMGSALAFGCGGISHDAATEHDGTGGSSGGSAGGSGGASGSGGSGGTNGSSAGNGNALGGTGGGISTGGGIILGGGGGTGGSSGGMAGAAGELGCPPDQWVCTSSLACLGSDLPTASDCSCDETLPTSPKDCRADQTFVCRGARHDSNGYPLAQPLPYECHCVTAAADCQTACAATFGDRSRCIDDGEQIPSDTTLCDCAMVILR